MAGHYLLHRRVDDLNALLANDVQQILYLQNGFLVCSTRSSSTFDAKRMAQFVFTVFGRHKCTAAVG
jgi:hypothetical protein